MIRLLIADDSALMRRLFSEIFSAEGDFEFAVARDGQEALAQVAAFQPDVITLDLNMPGVDGMSCLDRIMIERPTPVVVVSTLTVEGANETIRALELGAVAALAKPTGAVSLKMESFGRELIAAVRAAAQTKLSPVHRLAERVRSRIGPTAGGAPLRKANRRADDEAPFDGLAVIGCSTGGPAALDAVLSALPDDFPWPILVAQHMPAAFTGALARRLDALTPLSVREVTRAVRLRRGEIYIGRGDADMVVAARPGGLIAIAAPPDPQFPWRPSVDRLTESVLAHVPPARVVGILMTGMGNDGAAAMTRLRGLGGRTIAEAETTAVVWGMPGELVRAGGAEFIEPLPRIGRRLVELAFSR